MKKEGKMDLQITWRSKNMGYHGNKEESVSKDIQKLQNISKLSEKMSAKPHFIS